jgi:hypothetical protein
MSEPNRGASKGLLMILRLYYVLLHHIRVYTLIIVSFIMGFPSGGGITILPTMLMATTHPSRIHQGFLP